MAAVAEVNVSGVGRFINIRPNLVSSLIARENMNFSETVGAEKVPLAFIPEITRTTDRFDEVVREAMKTRLTIAAGTILKPRDVKEIDGLGIKSFVSPAHSVFVAGELRKHQSLKWSPGVSHPDELDELVRIVRDSNLTRDQVVGLKAFPTFCSDAAALKKALEGPYRIIIDELKLKLELVTGDLPGNAVVVTTPLEFEVAAFEAPEESTIYIGSPKGGRGLQTVLDIQAASLDYPEFNGLPVAAFGGVNNDNIPELLQGGVGNFGTSTLFTPDIVSAAAKSDYDPGTAAAFALMKTIKRALA